LPHSADALKGIIVQLDAESEEQLTAARAVYNQQYGKPDVLDQVNRRIMASKV
jgi:hypothetical protein